jgi:hypothetical protein
MIRVAVFICSMFFLSSCYYDVEEELYPGSNCQTIELPTYTNSIKAVIDANCATSGCHVDGGTGPANFTSYQGFVDYLPGGFEARVIDARDMPPSIPLTPCDYQLFQIWITNGAPE